MSVHIEYKPPEFMKKTTKKKIHSFSICLPSGGNFVTILYVLEIIINMKNEMEGVKKYIEGISKKTDQSITWMKQHFIQFIKYNLANPGVPVTGEFCKFGLCFNLNLVKNFASNPKMVEHKI